MYLNVFLAFIRLILTIAVIMELATWIVVGPPWLRLPYADILAEIEDATLNKISHKPMLSTPHGYVSTCGFSLLTGMLYYNGAPYRDRETRTRIPWWSPLYRVVKNRICLLQTENMTEHIE